MNRRGFLSYGTMALNAAIGVLLLVPGAAFVLDPLGKKRSATKTYPLCKLGELEVGRPRSFSIIDSRQDAWVKHPREAIGQVWLVRQPEGSKEKVVAFSAECPHLGCGVKLSVDQELFQCPCHNAAFTLDGHRDNRVSPRSLDSLEVEPLTGADPTILVKFQRFRAQDQEKIPLA